MSALLLLLFRLMILGAFIVLFVGLFKPEWLRFRGKQPDLLMTFVMAIGLFMIGFTGASKTHYAIDGQISEQAESGMAISEAIYANNSGKFRCKAGEKIGRIGASNDEKTGDGIRFSVKTPANYKDTHPHPLLMVYAPAGRDRGEAEELMYLTKEATAAGFIVAYADHRPGSPESIIQLAEIPKVIEQKWCIDKKKIFLTGHSDGGTVSMGMAFINGTKHIPAAIAPSAVGIRGADLEDRNCVKPLPVMVMHSRRDKLFPNFGKEAVEWWAKCNKCETKLYKISDRKIPKSGKYDWESYYQQELKQRSTDLAAGSPPPMTKPVEGFEGCYAYSGCKNGVQTWYCEGDAPHPMWPGRNKEIISFFKAVIAE
jgi:polyhydroxybutyrate depolymerase